MPVNTLYAVNTKEVLYPLIDRISNVEGKDQWLYRGVITGEIRAPKKGEWYLSGAIPEGYRAPNNLTQEFHILRIVKVRKIEYFEVEDYLTSENY